MGIGRDGEARGGAATSAVPREGARSPEDRGTRSFDRIERGDRLARACRLRGSHGRDRSWAWLKSSCAVAPRQAPPRPRFLDGGRRIPRQLSAKQKLRGKTPK